MELHGQPENSVRKRVPPCRTWTAQVWNVSTAPTVTSDNKRTLNSSDGIVKGSAPNVHPCALNVLKPSHLSCRSFTSVTIASQRWFKLASLSFKKLPSVAGSLWTILSPVLFSAAKPGCWLLIPSSSSYNRVQPQVNSATTWRCSDARGPPGSQAFI